MLISEGAPIHERYDLKGSWIHRLHSPPSVGQRVVCRQCGQHFRVGTRRDKNQCPARPNHQHEPNTILLDSDWDYKLRLAKPQARALISTIKSDTEWLREQGIMDYSLLLGIHRSRYNLTSLDRGGVRADIAPPATYSAPPATQQHGAPIPIPRPAPLQTTERPPLIMPPFSLGSPLPVSLSSFALSSPSLALSLDSGNGQREEAAGSGGASSPRGAMSPVSPIISGSTAAPPFNAGFSLMDELDSGAGTLFVEEAGTQVERLGGGGDAAAAAPSPFHEYRGGMRAVVVEGPGIYYLGLIDVLQQWTWEKRAEHWIKTRLLCQEVTGLSAVNPAAYALRFKHRVLAQLIEGYEQQSPV